MPEPTLRMVTPGKPDQVPLFHDSFSAALQTAINALGGSKRVAHELWPTLGIEIAYARLRHALQDDRPEKLSPDEVMTIAKRASAIGCHAIADFMANECGYEFRPLDADEARKRARRARKAQILAELARLMEDEDD